MRHTCKSQSLLTAGAGPVPITGSLATLLLIILSILLAGCGSTPPASVDAEQVLGDAVDSMKTLTSFHFSYVITKPQGAKPPQGTEIVSIRGYVSLEGSMKATVDLNQSGVPLQLDFVATANTHYVQNPTSQKWQSVPADLSPLGKISLTSGAIEILERVKDAQYVATESVGGAQCYKLKGSIAAADIASIVASANADNDLDCLLWIGAEDHLVRRIQTVGAAEADEDPRLLRTIELSQFGDPVVIEVPQ